MRLRRQKQEVDANRAGGSDVYEERATTLTWSPAQLIALAVGIGFVVLGAAVLAKTGSSHLYTPLVVVWHLGHSPLLGWIDVGFGLLLILTAVIPGGVRAFMGLLGAGALAFGIVVLVDAAPNRLHRWLGVTHTNGWLYVGVGAALVLAAFALPVFVIERHRQIRRPDAMA
jgi:hypothetical protein